MKIYSFYMKSLRLGIIAISILDKRVNQRQSLVISGTINSIFLTADEGRCNTD